MIFLPLVLILPLYAFTQNQPPFVQLILWVNYGIGYVFFAAACGRWARRP
jgi:4-hydroxybenzoate polyprenyltransferase